MPCGHQIVRRAQQPWDRFYRYHKLPWRGERDIEPLRPWLGSGRVLELGCGNGKLLKPLRRAGFAVMGIDISWHAATMSRGIAADAAKLPFADSSFSSVMDIHCTGHLNLHNRLDALRESHRVVQPGGHLVCRRLGPLDLRAHNGDQVDGDANTLQLQDGRTTHFTAETELVGDLERAGFAVVAQQTVEHHPRLRGKIATRQNVQVVGQKAQE